MKLPIRYRIGGVTILLLVLFVSVMALLWHHSFGLRNFLWERANVPIHSELFTKKEHAPLAVQMGNYYNNYGVMIIEYNVPRANSYYTKALTLDPKVRGAHFHIGLNEFVLGKLLVAIKRFNQELELATNDDRHSSESYYLRTLYMRGLTYGFVNKYEEGADDFRHLIVINAGDSRSWAYYTDLAWMYFQQGKFQEIRDIMEGGMLLGDDSVPEEEREVDIGGYARYPDNPWVLNMYGLALHNLGESERAYEFLEQAYEEVQNLTVEDWVAAYPGNDPSEAQIGLAEFKRSIETNIRVAKEAIKQR